MTLGTDAESPTARHTLLLLPLGASAGIAAALWPKLALIACFVTLLAVLFFKENRARQPLASVAALLIAVIGSGTGLARFIVAEAIPGIARGGETAVDNSAVSQLRQIVTAEDALRRGAFIDPDHDGIGSAAGLRELSGLTPLRGYGFLNPPALGYEEAQVVQTPIGPAVEVGAYLFVVCLPTTAGALSADPNATIDDEAAERHFVAYAWPLATGMGSASAFCVDEHERIWVSKNQENAAPRYAGPSFPPSCDAVLKDGDFQTWMGKKARERLPGDKGP